MPSHRVALSGPDIGPEELALVERVVRSGRLACGPVLDEFEAAFAAQCGVAHAVGVSSGTAGLHLAMIAANVHEGDYVITTPFSFVATANAVLYERALPLFVDIDPVSLALDVSAVADVVDDFRRGVGVPSASLRRAGARAGRLAAILPVHVFGRMADMPALMDASRAAGVPLIEDACEAVGASIDGIPAGAWGAQGVFGFYPNKQITTGEGGIVTTNDDATAALLRSLRNHGRDGSLNEGLHERLGFNYRLDELSAAVGLAQIRRLDDILANRTRVAELYNRRLKDCALARPLATPPANVRMSWFVYPVRLDASINRDAVMAQMDARGIPTRSYFWPIHLQPYYRKRFGYEPGDFPHAEAAGRSFLALPFHGNLTDADVDDVCGCLEEELSRVGCQTTAPTR